MRSGCIRRREFISLLGSGVVAWPLAAHAQQRSPPVVGFLRSSSADGSAHLVAAFRRGLAEQGFTDGQNITIEFRWGLDNLDQLSALAADLARIPVAVFFAGASSASLAAKSATSTIPIVFVTSADPVKSGMVKTLNRPGGNATGITYPTSTLAGKRLEFMNLLLPRATSIAVLVNPKNPTTEPFIQDVQKSGGVLGVKVPILKLSDEHEFESVFAKLADHRADALIVGADPMFTAHPGRMAALAERNRLPAIFTTREFAVAGGLMSWGVSLTEQYRLGGVYVGKILKGAKPADLPVLQPAKYELVLNLKTAKALGVEPPPQLLALADEVIE